MACHSYSALSAFEQCPKKYEYRYILKPVVEQTTTVEAFLGSRVHEALERLYRDVSMGRSPSADDVVAWYASTWEAQWSDEVAIARAEYTKDDYRGSGERMLRTYHARYAPFDEGVTVGLELRVNADVDDEGRFGLVGYIDRLVRVSDGVYEIHDYKTGRSLPTQRAVDEDLQLALYELAVRRSYSDIREVTLVWHYLALDAELRSTRTPEQLEAMRADVIGRLGAIERCTEYPTKTSELCGWCEYRPLCSAWAHERDLRTPAAEDDARSGVELVDRLVELDTSISALESEREDLRARLIAWSNTYLAAVAGLIVLLKNKDRWLDNTSYSLSML